MKSNQNRMTPEAKLFDSFVRAARYARGRGAASIHPGTKIRLLGLLLQAQRGDCDTIISRDDQFATLADIAHIPGVDSKLRAMKLRAWMSNKGKKREEAMEEYIHVLSSIVPQWKVEAMLGRGSTTVQHSKKMAWALRISFAEGSPGSAPISKRTAFQNRKEALFRANSGNSRLQRARSLNGKDLKVTSIAIVQASNASNAKMWNEEDKDDDEGGQDDKSKSTNDKERDRKHSPALKFIENMPTQFQLSDLIVDKKKHKTFGEQRAEWFGKMVSLAKGDRGWEYSMDTAPSQLDGASLQVFARDVNWWPTLQLRSSTETSFSPGTLFDNWYQMASDEKIRKERPNEVQKSVRKYYDLWEFKTEHARVRLRYRVISYPW